MARVHVCLSPAVHVPHALLARVPVKGASSAQSEVSDGCLMGMAQHTHTNTWRVVYSSCPESSSSCLSWVVREWSEKSQKMGGEKMGVQKMGCEHKE